MKKTPLTLWNVIFLVIMVLSSCTRKKTEVIIVHVNDMHAKIDRFPHLVTLVDSLRANHKHVILISAGDLFSGNPVVDKYFEKGKPMIDLMNMAGFDLSCIGNHEFDYGLTVLEKRIKEAAFPLLAVNMYPPFLQEQDSILTMKIDDIILHFIGTTQVNNKGIPDTKPDLVKGLQFMSTLDYFDKHKDDFSGKKNIIAVTHQGFKLDSILATRNPYIDIIIGGHSHTLLTNAPTINDVLITQAGNYLKYAGVLSLIFQGDKLIAISDTVYNLSMFKPERKTKQYVDSINKETNFDIPVGNIGTTLENTDETANLMAQAILRITGADIAFQNNGGARVSRIDSGLITLKTIYELDPFNNQLVVVSMDSVALKEVIIEAYKVNKRKEIHVAGIAYRIFINKEGNPENVHLIRKEKKLKPIYKVAMSYYIAEYFNLLDHAEYTAWDENTALVEYVKTNPITIENCPEEVIMSE